MPFSGLAAVGGPAAVNEPKQEKRDKGYSFGFDDLGGLIEQPKYEEIKHEEVRDARQQLPQPYAMKKEHSSDSYGEDGTFMELSRRDFSISIPEAKTIEEKGYFSTSSYTVFIVQTKSNLAMYKNKDVHTVDRRFSDFEYLL